MNKLNFLADWLPKRGHCTAARSYKSRETWRETPHRCGFWWDVQFFSQVKKHRSRFWPRLKRKPSEEYLEYFDLWVVNRSFERYSCLEFILKNSKHAENLQGFIHDSGLSEKLHSQCMSSSDFVNKHCFRFKCFFEWYNFLVLIVCQDLFLVAFPVVIFSSTRTSHSGVLKMPRVSNEYRSLEVTEMQTKMILRPLPTSVHSNTRLELQVWTQHGKADFGNYI